MAAPLGKISDMTLANKSFFSYFAKRCSILLNTPLQTSLVPWLVYYSVSEGDTLFYEFELKIDLDLLLIDGFRIYVDRRTEALSSCSSSVGHLNVKTPF